MSELSLLRPAVGPPESARSGTIQRDALMQALADGRPGRLIGDVVVDLGFATREKVEEAVEIARAQGKPTGQILVEQGILRHDQLARVVAERFGLEYIDLSVYELDMSAVNLIDMEAIRRYQAVPVGFLEDGTLMLAMADPTNVLTIDDIAMLTGRRVRSASASIEDLNILIMRLSRVEQSVEEIVEEDDSDSESEFVMDEADKDAPVVKLVHSIIADAIEQGASDIHIDPGEGDMHVSFRIDGVLALTSTLKRSMATSIISRIKIMSEMDISERRVPQDGRFALTVSGRRVDVRVTTLPLVYGEGAYLRILDKGVAVRGLESLGMQRTEQDRFAYAIGRPNGAVLVTGPTGSGKSTTLYAALGAVNDGSRSILTIEDPVESRIAGVKQMQVAPKAGMTFAGGLRAMLRADPDVIMVGEIRDRETAHIAVEAALTGHLVLSTLHTRDAPSALGRLIDMGIEPFPDLLRDRLRSRAAACAHALPALQASKQSAGVLARRIWAVRVRGVRASRLHALRHNRLQGAYGHLRGDVGHRGGSLAGAGPCLSGRHRGRCNGPRDATHARRRHRQGARRADLDRGDRAHDHEHDLSRRASVLRGAPFWRGRPYGRRCSFPK